MRPTSAEESLESREDGPPIETSLDILLEVINHGELGEGVVPGCEDDLGLKISLDVSTADICWVAVDDGKIPVEKWLAVVEEEGNIVDGVGVEVDDDKIPVGNWLAVVEEADDGKIPVGKWLAVVEVERNIVDGVGVEADDVSSAITKKKLKKSCVFMTKTFK